MSPQTLEEGSNNEPAISWARHQLAVTVHKDDELVSSSPYAMFDSQDPVTKFTDFISDESIVDKVNFDLKSLTRFQTNERKTIYKTNLRES